jgi:hypothetical protein
MAMLKKLAILAVAGLALGATACGSKAEDTATTPTTAATATTADEKKTTTTEDESTDTTTKPKKTTTTVDEDDKPKTKVTKPAKVEKIDKAQLPSDTPSLPASWEITSEEEDCVYTVVYEYTQDPTNATDDATLSGVLGGAMAACIDQDSLAAGIVASVAEAAPELTATQLSCLEGEIAGADTESLAVFLGAVIYEGEGAEELQQPFLEALDEACGLSS